MLSKDRASFVDEEKVFFLTEEEYESLFEYCNDDGDFLPFMPIINFYTFIKNEKLQIDEKVDIDCRKINVSKELSIDFVERMSDKAEEYLLEVEDSTKPDFTSNTARLMWLNNGPSHDEKLRKYEVCVEEGAFLLSKEKKKA